MARFWILVLVTAAGILATLGSLTDKAGPGSLAVRGQGSPSTIAEAPIDTNTRGEEPINRRAADRRAQRSAATAIARDEERTLLILQRAGTQGELRSPREAQPRLATLTDATPSIEASIAVPPTPSVVAAIAGAEPVMVEGGTDETAVPGAPSPAFPVSAVPTSDTPAVEPEPARATHVGVSAVAATATAVAVSALGSPASLPAEKAERRAVRHRNVARKPRPHRAGRHSATRRLVVRRIVQQEIVRSSAHNRGG